MSDEIKILTLARGRDACRRREIKNGRALCSQGSSLKTRGQITVAPIRRAALRIADFRQYDESRQIMVDRAKSVCDPRTDAGVAAETVATIHLIHGRGMVHTVDDAASVETDLVSNVRQVGPVLSHVRTGFTSFDELKRAADVVTLSAFHRRLLFPRTHEFLQVHFVESRLWIESVDVRWTTFHHQEDHVPGLRISKMPRFRRQRIFFWGFVRQKCAECDTAETGTKAADNVAPLWHAGLQATVSRHKQTRLN